MEYKDIYNFNIRDIISKWGNYPYVSHCNEDSTNVNNVGKAINAGIVELKCFINNQCPFNKSGYHEESVIFNFQTVDRLKNFLPRYARDSIVSHKGIDGIFFDPKYIYRHNYIFIKKKESTEVNYGSTISDDFFNNNYEEINEGSNIFGSQFTRYKSEQSWILQKSVFDKIEVNEDSDDKNNELNSECINSSWHYFTESVSRSDESDLDTSYDYIGKYYDEQLKYYSEEDNRDPKILRKSIQVPVQTRVYSEKDGSPIHWRLVKKTPLFRGEDFFVTFYKKASRPTIDKSDKKNGNSQGGSGLHSFSNLNPFYNTLDVTKYGSGYNVKGNVFKNEENKRGKYEKRINEGVLSLPLSNNSNDLDDALQPFYFYNQPYYIIEMGYLSEKGNYFIIITEKNNPVFVMVQKLGNGYVSSLLSVCKSVNGKQLIDSNLFTVTVRNHLGKIVVVFNNDQGTSDPWVISRADIEPYYNNLTQEVDYKYVNKEIYVPRGLMTIWGGNIRCGFSFGPLQYKLRNISFSWPPRPNDDADRDKAFSTGAPKNLYSDQQSKGVWEDVPFYLPMDPEGSVIHNISLTTSTEYLPDLFKDFNLGGTKIQTKRLFMQDAQYYREYRGNSSSNWEYGSFMYGKSLKEESDVSLPYVNKSVLSVRKNRFLNDNSTRKQSFDLMIGMQSGDHVFTNLYWDKIFDQDKPHGSSPGANPFSSSPQGRNISDSQWYLPNCKTPILNHIRLISEESRYPRWDDGTSINSGVSFAPIGSSSPYFIDASNHVLSFSDSWSSNGWSEVEHTGSINFYLHNGIRTFGEWKPEESDAERFSENESDRLFDLQNKTFYIEIWARYRPCQDDGYNLNTGMYGFFKLCTGLCHGGIISHEYNKHIMTCKIEDYTTVLKGMKFYNAPWFDGMKDISAVWEILRMSGFRSRGRFDPASLIRAKNEVSRFGNIYNGLHLDGRFIKMEPYALPSGYNRLEQPSFKPKDGDPYYNVITDFAKKSSKVFFFDQFGIAHYEEMQDMIEKDYKGEVSLDNYVLFHFTSNPNLYGGQLMLNKIERSFDVNLISNHIKIVSNTPDMHLIVRDALNWSSFDNPDSEGFMGYLKSYIEHEGMYGSVEAVTNAVNKYKVMFRPVVNVKFDAYGIPLRANDIIKVNDETMRVIRVNHNIDASKNEWIMSVEAHRYQPVSS